MEKVSEQAIEELQKMLGEPFDNVAEVAEAGMKTQINCARLQAAATVFAALHGNPRDWDKRSFESVCEDAVRIVGLLEGEFNREPEKK